MVNMKSKRSFVLLEVMIAISLFTMISTWTYRSLARHFHEQLMDLRRIESQRLAELTFFTYLDEWVHSGSFDEPMIQFDSVQSLSLSEQTLTRNVTITSTDIRVHNDHEIKKITLKIHYPELETKMQFPLVISRISQDRQKISS